MGLGDCYTCIKYLMFAFNFLFWLLGCAILGVGVWVRVDSEFEKYVDNTDDFNYLYTGAYILIVVGVIVMVIGFLGCCGAIRESQCMLVLFFVFLFLIFAVLLAAGIWAIVSKDTLKESVTNTLRDAVKKYKTDTASKTLMDNVQTNFKCCGAEYGSIDYKLELPPATCNREALIPFNKPCAEELFNYFNKHLIIVAGVAIGIGIVMLLGMIFACCLCCAIRQGQKV